MQSGNKASKIEANKNAYHERKKEYRHYKNFQKEEIRRQPMKPKKSELTVGRALNFHKLKNGLIKKYVEGQLNLEDLQYESISKITDTKNNDYSLSSGYFHACTGFGKTYLMLAMAEGYREEEKNKKIVIFEENTGVLEQVKQDFIDKASFKESDIGAFYGPEKTLDTPIIICTYASMKKMLKEVGKENIGLVLCDEAHHVLSDNRKSIANELSTACLYGFTATPKYDEDKNCAKVFGNLIDSVTIEEGVRSGLLCGVKNGLLVSKVEVDLSKIHHRCSINNDNCEYDADELLAAIEKASPKRSIKEALADFYLNGYDENLGAINGKTTIINTPSQKEADALAKVLNKKAGKTIAKAYHTKTREKNLTEFNDGKFPILVQVNKISEGYNNPKVEVCINYPTASLVRETQSGGRTLRYDRDNPLKMALVLDIVFVQDRDGNVYDEAAKNGQVLFKDVAGAYCLTSEKYEQNQARQDAKRKRNVKASDLYYEQTNSLFDVTLNSKELYIVNWGYDNILRERENLREINETDMTKESFLKSTPNFVIRYDDEKNEQFGVAADSKVKRLIWNAVKASGYNIIYEVKDGDKLVNVLPKENMQLFREWVEDHGFIWQEYDRLSKNSDMTKDEFVHERKMLLRIDNNRLFPLTLYRLWDDMKKNNFLLHTKSDIDVLPSENLESVKEWLNKKGIDVYEYERNIIFSDMTSEVFCLRFDLYKNGKYVPDWKKEYLCDEIIRNTDISIPVYNGKKVIRVIPKENMDQLPKIVTDNGFKIRSFIRTREKTDITRISISSLVSNKLIYRSNKVLVYTNSYQHFNLLSGKAVDEIWEELRKQNLTERVYDEASKKIFSNLSEEKMPLIEKFFETHGVKLLTLGKRCRDYFDITLKEFKDGYEASDFRVFYKNRLILKKGETEIYDYREKLRLWDLLDKKTNLLIATLSRDDTKVIKILPEENMEEAQKFFAKMGITFGYSREVSQERLSRAQRDATFANTKEKRREYLAQAKTIFEQLNPEVKKKNICARCLKKIKGGRK